MHRTRFTFPGKVQTTEDFRLEQNHAYHILSKCRKHKYLRAYTLILAEEKKTALLEKYE
jgi:hypothetical protein